MKCKPNKNKYKTTVKGAIQPYEIIQNAIRPPTTRTTKSKANPILTQWHIIQEPDQDMIDSSSPANNKRG
jgi:hypothetical protein